MNRSVSTTVPSFQIQVIISPNHSKSTKVKIFQKKSDNNTFFYLQISLFVPKYPSSLKVNGLKPHFAKYAQQSLIN